MDPPTNTQNCTPQQQEEEEKKKKKKKKRRKYYRECMKNHAAALGAHALDGCRKFTASPTYVPSDPSSLTCAACSCHRNFHRPIFDDGNDDDEEEAQEEEEDQAAGSHVLLTLKTGGGGPPPAAAVAGGGGEPGALVVRPMAMAGTGRRKRYRSKFSKEQKEGMMELAERVGWRLQRREEEVVEQGCRRIGVERGVFKVWMHNNKQGVLMDMKNKNKNKNKNKMMMMMMTTTTTNDFDDDHDHEINNNNNNNNNNNRGVVNGNVSVSDNDGVKSGSTVDY